VLNDFEPEGFSAGAGSNTSDTTVPELFLEVIVRHVPGRMAKKVSKSHHGMGVRDFTVRPCPERSGLPSVLRKNLAGL
jgi:hypothetical protein